MINYSTKLTRAETLMVLYNNANKYEGHEQLIIPGIEVGDEMDIKSANRIIDYMLSHFGNAYFRTFNNRMLNIDLTDGKSFDESLYNEFNGLTMRLPNENYAKNCLIEYYEDKFYPKELKNFPY